MKEASKIGMILLSVLFCALVSGPAQADTDSPKRPAGTLKDGETGSAALSSPGSVLQVSTEALPAWFPKVLGMQFNGVYQYMPPFHTPYEGPNSLSFRNGRGHDFSQTYGLYLGSQLAPGLQLYLDSELFRGNGISDGVGLGGYVNGDAIRAGSSNLSKTPYVARLYLRYFRALSPETGKVERAMDQLPGEEAVAGWEVKFGKLAATDDFDLNRYANNNRTQFMNFDFLYNTAWDFAADTRGYSYGLFTAFAKPRWKLAFGAYMEANAGNGPGFDYVDPREFGYNLELTLKPNQSGSVLRLLCYLNESRMGSYDKATALGRATSTVPDLLLVEKQGGTKYGLGLNFEQPLADQGETGLFGRLGWNDGGHESWAYAEADRHASLGVQVSGVHWGRQEDRLGVACGTNGLSSAHRNYLAAGGVGILLGDGGLNYGWERLLEAYYSIRLGSYLQLSPDFQLIQNPGYNRDRGPAEVYGLRAHLSF